MEKRQKIPRQKVIKQMTNTQNPAKMGAKISDQFVPQRGCKYKVRWDLKKGGGDFRKNRRREHSTGGKIGIEQTATIKS